VVNDTLDIFGGKASAINFKNNQTSEEDETFTHIAEVASATDAQGRTLSATGVAIAKDRALVSYHLNGSKYSGAVELFDISDPNNLQILSKITFADTDVNDVTLSKDGDKAWITGGRKMSSSDYDKEGHEGAVAGEITIQGDSFDTSIREVPLQSFSGNAVVQNDKEDRLYVTTGSTGGMYAIDIPSFNVVESVPEDYTKQLDIRKEMAVSLALGGEESTAKLYMTDFKDDEVSSLDTGINVTPLNGKNVVDQGKDITYVALGSQGIRGYDFERSESEAEVYSFTGGTSGLASGVAADKYYVYVAHGSAGMYILEIPDNEDEGLRQIYKWDDDGEVGSANYVGADKKNIFLAKGTAGLNIFKREKD
jgi:WD40 repeat protein